MLDNPARASCSGWCSSERETGDLLGVWILANFNGLSCMTPLTFRIEDTAIVAIEPKIVE